MMSRKWRNLIIFLLIFLGVCRAFYSKRDLNLTQLVERVSANAPQVKYKDFAFCSTKVKYNLMSMVNRSKVLDGGTYTYYTFYESDGASPGGLVVDTVYGDDGTSLVVYGRSGTAKNTSFLDYITNVFGVISNLGDVIVSLFDALFEFLIDILNLEIWLFTFAFDVCFA